MKSNFSIGPEFRANSSSRLKVGDSNCSKSTLACADLASCEARTLPEESPAEIATGVFHGSLRHGVVG